MYIKYACVFLCKALVTRTPTQSIKLHIIVCDKDKRKITNSMREIGGGGDIEREKRIINKPVKEKIK